MYTTTTLYNIKDPFQTHQFLCNTLTVANVVVVVVVAAACLRTVTESYSLKSLRGSYCNKTRFYINLSVLYDIRVLCQPFTRSESPKQALRGSYNSWTPKCNRL